VLSVSRSPPLDARLVVDQISEVSPPRLEVFARLQSLLLGVEAFELGFERVTLFVVVRIFTSKFS